MSKVILVDKYGKEIGLKDKFIIHHNPVPLHRAISVLIFNNKSVLLQKRALNKPTWPGFWSNTACTHPIGEEEYLDAAQRRLKEEMGIKAPLKEKFRFIYQAEYDAVWGENEYDVVFTGEYVGKIKADPAEVADYKWIKISDLKKDIIKNPDSYTPWLKIILEKYSK
jgi:isopentenyl-diphosphate delta-isomerase